MSPTILWFRRDLRLADHPALAAAAAEAGTDGVVALFVLDPRLRRPSGSPRLAFLAANLRALNESLDGRLVVRTGDPAAVVPAVAREVGAESVFVTADFGPYGRTRDDRVAATVALERVGSPYAVAPGTLRRATGDGPYRVFSPYHRAWLAHGWPAPLDVPPVTWCDGIASDAVPDDVTDVPLPEPGEAAAVRQRDAFLERIAAYGRDRNVPGADATSRLSPYLKYGCIHPRQILDRLPDGEGARRFSFELAWRDFYADILWHRPDSIHRALQPSMESMPYDSGRTADDRYAAWREGRTGYPFVDAGMRQLATEGWIHNRVRMVVASFLVKDLHLDWQRGARWFHQRLVDGDLASNHHGWQWVAGTGTDPAPYFRVFNPITQSQKFDPDGVYIRRYVRELADVAAPAIHEPWTLPGGPPNDYPAPIVDHAAERRDALARYDTVKERRGA